MDVHYAVSFNDVSSTITIPAYKDNTFSLGWVNLGVRHEGSNYGAQANLVFGPKSHEFFETSFYTNEESPFNYIRDAFVYFKPTEKLTLNAGLFQNFYSYEWDDVYLNNNYSHGYIYTVASQGFAGAKADYVFNDKWNATLGVFTNLYQREETDSDKLIALNVNYTGDLFEGGLSLLRGAEPDGITH
ncbi:MAG: outer membrane beta-barrel protein, partial [Flavobacteriales bacterium]